MERHTTGAILTCITAGDYHSLAPFKPYMVLSSLPYRLESYAGPKTRFTCPSCGKPREFTRWIDQITGQYLPAAYGFCNRRDACGYALSPYEKSSTGQSYVDLMREQGNLNTAIWPKLSPERLTASTVRPPCTIPSSLVTQTLTHYECNNFAQFLRGHFGVGVATNLLQRFEVGTSSHWPRGTIFWQRDELGRVRGGQVVLFDEKGHTAKQVGVDGEIRRCTTWVHTAYAQACKQRGDPYEPWLAAYLDPANATQKSPSLYGLAQALSAPANQSIGVVEAPKTAVYCAGALPALAWTAVGSLSYLNIERLRPLKDRRIILYPDASSEGTAYNIWKRKAKEMCRSGFMVEVSDVLERKASAVQKAAGIDIADILIEQWPGYPLSWDYCS